jgi:hypothetical protein
VTTGQFLAIQSTQFVLLACVGPEKYRDVFGVMSIAGAVVATVLMWRGR